MTGTPGRAPTARDAAVDAARNGARTLPTGTVTFVFTDIEGSTRLTAALGPEGYGPLLERHRTLLRAAFSAGGGVEVGTEGDSFFVVFPSTSRALEAAIDGQRALAAETWPPDAVIRVRMGLHTGEGRLAAGTYVGPDVNRAARIAAAGHGGQILLSETTRALVQDALPPGSSLRDLGEHRLKDIRPERLVQLDAPGLASEFPPIRSLDQRPNNLPTQLTSFVGRERELADVLRLLDGSRLLTLTGPGGTGKTRLALQLAAAAADRFPDGLWFVPLEPLRDPSLVAATIARTLGLADSGARPAIELVAEAIGSRRVLLVMDNFEQIVDAGPIVSGLLRACPNLAIVATSRAPLRVSGEQEFPVPGLPIPPDPSRMTALETVQLPAAVRQPDPEVLAQYEAVRLFVARAVAVRPDFRVTTENASAVATICARLQGLPLAIELAAARVKVLTPDAILARLQRQLDLLASGARDLPERQRSLRGAIASSYELLEEGCRRLLDRLSVFVGGCDLAMAERVCGPFEELGVDVLDGLAMLADQSLLRTSEESAETRFELLDTIRAFAAEQLEASGDGERISRRHAEAYLDLAEEAAPHLAGADQRDWLDRLERDHDNFRAAIEWAVAQPEPEMAARLGFALWRFWQQRGYLNEARERLTGMVDLGWDLPPVCRARLYEAVGGIYYWQADPVKAGHAYDEALAIWRDLGDRREIANALYNAAYTDLQPILFGGVGDPVRSHARMEEALGMFREVGDVVGEGNAMWGLGSLDYFEQRFEDAERWFVASTEVFRGTSNRTMLAWSEKMLGTALLKLDRVDDALAVLVPALRHFYDAGDLSGVTFLLDDLSVVALYRGDRPRAARLRGAARHLQASTGTEVAVWVDRTRPNVATAIPAADLERYGAEGAAMSLDEIVAYALGETGVAEASAAASGAAATGAAATGAAPGATPAAASAEDTAVAPG